MRVRNNIISLWLSDGELSHLETQAFIAGKKISPFIRDRLMGVKLKPHNPEAMAQIIRELSAQGNNLNQLAKVANTTGVIEQSKSDELLKTQSQIWQKVRAL